MSWRSETRISITAAPVLSSGLLENYLDSYHTRQTTETLIGRTIIWPEPRSHGLATVSIPFAGLFSASVILKLGQAHDELVQQFPAHRVVRVTAAVDLYFTLY